MVEVDKDAKLITCIVPKGKASPLMEKLYNKGVTRINFAFARGSDIHDPEGQKGLPVEEEKEILTIVAKNHEEGEELFEFIFENSEINQLGGGIMYMSRLAYAMPYALPDLGEQEETPAESKKAAKEEPESAKTEERVMESENN